MGVFVYMVRVCLCRNGRHLSRWLIDMSCGGGGVGVGWLREGVARWERKKYGLRLVGRVRRNQGLWLEP